MGDCVYSISKKDDHYEVYINGIFYCSADSMSEAANELEEYLERSETVK